MIARYTRPEMGVIWSDLHKYECWLEVELAAAEALADLGEVPHEAAKALVETMASKGAAEPSRWLHYGLTSNDVVDTAQALQIRDASRLIASGLEALSAALKTLAFEHKHTVQIGRTHGMHAEPITFGLKAALWWDELERHRRRFAAA